MCLSMCIVGGTISDACHAAGGFLKEHEDWDVNFRFSVGNTTEIIQGLKEEKYDIALCSRKEKESGID